MSKQTLERIIYVLVIVLSVITLALIKHTQFFLQDTKVVYQGF